MTQHTTLQLSFQNSGIRYKMAEACIHVQETAVCIDHPGSGIVKASRKKGFLIGIPGAIVL